MKSTVKDTFKAVITGLFLLIVVLSVMFGYRPNTAAARSVDTSTNPVALDIAATSGTVTMTVLGGNVPYGGVMLVSLSCTSDASGNVRASIDLAGVLSRVVANPDTPAPSDNWDLSITDANSLDILQAWGANQDTADTATLLDLSAGASVGWPIAVNGPHALVISNMGNAKKVKVDLYVKR